ncbi:M20/M25/M40 family metallo-hydrolase [Gammaproteobacteria bacterium]|nr:M20/M25/M40 family metallo-hydrolase [Gammaproteobacteria bacterium]
MNKLFISLLMFSNISLISATETIETEAVEWLKAYLQIETVNPPGNESRAVDYIANIFEQEGIEFNSAESAPGRGNIWARIEGGDKPALVLLHHSDVVPVNEKYWDFDPFSGEIKDGYILGRGALDMKGTGISHLANFINLYRQGKKLNRDVIFIGAADEESGGNFGVGWLVKNHPEIFEGAGLLLNEGGSGYKSNDSIVFSVEITQKVPVWLRLTAIDTPGHGSSPRSTSSVSRVVKALNIIWNNPFPPRIIPEVEKVFIERSGALDEPYSSEYRNIKESIKGPIFMQRLQSFSASAHALTRDTCSLTRMMGSSKINVVPPEAWAEVDCRMLPDRTTDEFISDFKALIKDTGVEVELIMSAVPAISQTDSELFLAIEDFSKNYYPGSRVAPSVSTGFTDSRFTRGLGIQSYGFNPLISTGDEYSSIHGNNERINEKAFRQSVKDLGIILDKILY